MIANRKPSYKNDCRIDMTAYLGPRRKGKHIYKGKYGAYPLDPEEGYPSFVTDDVFTLYKDAGLNLLLPEGDAFYGVTITDEGYTPEPDFEKSDLYEYMKMAEKHGLYVYPAVEEVFDHMAREDGPFGDKEKAILKDFVATVQKYFPKTFKGIMLTDEPPYTAIPRMKKIMEYLHSDEIAAIKPDLDVFGSMHPIYGPMKFLHEDYTGEQYNRLKYDEHRMIAYQSYMERTADAVGEISFDHYPFIYEHQLTPGFYRNLELAAELGKKKNYPVTVTIQSYQGTIRTNEKTFRGFVVHRAPKYEDARWQLYSALAFGVQRIGYYTFWTHYIAPEQPSAMVVFDPSEEKGYRTTEIYDAIKKVNEEVLAFDHVFLQYRWQGCRVIRTSRDQNIHMVKAGYDGSALKDLKAIRDLLVGCMENPEDHTEAFWIVNAENPFHVQVNDVEAVFEGANRAVYYRKGKEFDVPLEEGVFKIRLGIGEGIFVIPYCE